MKKISLDDFTKFKFLSNLEYSPNGKNAAFIVHEANLEDNDYNSNIWIIKEDNSYYQLTSSNKEKSFIWLNDNEILFSGERNHKDLEKKKAGEIYTKFYKININGGEAKEAFTIPHHITAIKQLNEDTYIFTGIYDPYRPDFSNMSGEEKEAAKKAQKEEKDYEVLEEIPFWSNGGGYTNKKRSRLYMYTLADKKTTPITDEIMIVDGFQLSKDKTKVVFSGNSFKDKLDLYNDLYIWEVGGEKPIKITNSNGRYSGGHFISHDSVVYLYSDMKEYGLNQNSKFYMMNILTGETKCLTPNFTDSISNTVGSDCRYGGGGIIRVDSNIIYFVSTQLDSSILYQVDLRGNVEAITKGNGSIDAFDVHKDNIKLIGLRGQMLQEVYAITNGDEVKLTSFNEESLKDKYVAKPQGISIETDTGFEVDGWVLLPIHYKEGEKYPAILNIHGGPKTVYGEVYYHEMQYWASEGYFVFFCNPRGSDGKGGEFADIRGKYGTIDYEDIMRFMDAVLEKYPAIDKERVGVTGGSYGGYMTNWIIGHTDRFKAAVSQRSISNWISMFGTTDIGYFFTQDQIAANPWENHDKLWWHSPLKYADKVKTPTLFIHSEEDYRCWWVEAIQMFTALKTFGVESRLCMFRGENHELSRSGKPKHRMRRLKEITGWMDKYLK